MLTPDWLVREPKSDCFVGDCECVCVAGCCGLEAFALPETFDELVGREWGRVVLSPEDLCLVRRRIGAMRRSLESCETAVESTRFNAIWNNGRECSEFFRAWEEWIVRQLEDRPAEQQSPTVP